MLYVMFNFLKLFFSFLFFSLYFSYWNRLEMFCRRLVENFEEVHIISGPLFLPETDHDSGKKYIRYEVSRETLSLVL